MIMHYSFRGNRIQCQWHAACVVIALSAVVAVAQKAPPPPDFGHHVDYVAWLNRNLSPPGEPIEIVSELPQTDPFGPDNLQRMTFRKTIAEWMESPDVLSATEVAELTDLLRRYVKFQKDVISENALVVMMSNREAPNTLLDLVLPLIGSIGNTAKAHLILAFVHGESAVAHFRRAAKYILGLERQFFYVVLRPAQDLLLAFYRALSPALRFGLVSPEDAIDLVALMETKSQPLPLIARDCITREEACHYSILQAIARKGLFWGASYDSRALRRFDNYVGGVDFSESTIAGFSGDPRQHRDSATDFFDRLRQEFAKPYSIANAQEVQRLERKFISSSPLYRAMPLRVDDWYDWTFEHEASGRAIALALVLAARLEATGQPPSIKLVPEVLKRITIDPLTNQPFRVELKNDELIVKSPGLDLVWDTVDDISAAADRANCETFNLDRRNGAKD